MAKCIVELVRIKGINKHRGDRKSREDNPPLISQEDLVKKLYLNERLIIFFGC